VILLPQNRPFYRCRPAIEGHIASPRASPRLSKQCGVEEASAGNFDMGVLRRRKRRLFTGRTNSSSPRNGLSV
jgi:hypothetical protein